MSASRIFMVREVAPRTGDVNSGQGGRRPAPAIIRFGYCTGAGAVLGTGVSTGAGAMSGAPVPFSAPPPENR